MYQMILIMFVIIQIGAINYSDSVNYCDLDCRTQHGIQKHTVCLRSNEKCGPHERCHNFQVLSQTDAFRQTMLDKHNQFRNKVALGQEKRGPQPKAANMNVLNWNEELAFIAQCWANTCEMELHDKCRRTEHLVVGQNMGVQSTTGPVASDDLKLAEASLQNWYNEVAGFNPATIQNYDGHPSFGHYTGMIWGEIQYVGCGATLYSEEEWNTVFLVCNYGGPTTGGNLLRAKVYEIGEPCSKCPSGTTCNEKYKGLCGIDFPVQTHTEHSYTPGYNGVSNAKSRYNFISSTTRGFSNSNGVSDSTIANNNLPMQRQQTLIIEVERPRIMFMRIKLRNF